MTEQEKYENTAKLMQKATEYVEDKEEESALKKRLDNNNKSIKALMELLGKDEVTLPGGDKVTYSITRRESLDEEKLMAILKKVAPETNCIKTKEYIDMDILENELYHEQLSGEAVVAMEQCRNVKEVPTLNIKKAKKGK